MKKYKLNKGILIAIEGIDGAGKTTQVRMLSEYFKHKGIDVVTFKEPTDGEYGQKIKVISRFGRHTVTPMEEFEIFLQNRIEDCRINIIPALEQNKLVIMDRYYFSNIAYQSVLGVNKEYIIKRNEEIAVIPDLVLILDVAVKIGLSRIIHNRKEEHNHFEKEEYLDKVRQVFLSLKDSYIQIIDGTQTEDFVFSNLKNIVQDIIAPHKTEDVSQIDLFESRFQNSEMAYFKN